MNRRLMNLVMSTALILGAASGLLAQNKPEGTGKAGGEKSRAANSSGMSLGRLVWDDSLFFLVTNGWKEPRPNSTNKTEQFWAEESVRDFFQQLQEEVKQTIEMSAQGNAEAMLAATTTPVLLNAIVTHPMAMSLISITPTTPPDVHLSLVIDTEEDAKDVRAAFDRLIESALAADPKSLTHEMIGETTFYSPADGEMPPNLVPQFGMYNSFLIVTVGDGIAAATIQKINRNRTSPPALEATLRDFNVSRPTSVWQLNVEAIFKLVNPLITDEQAQKVLAATGLPSLKRMAAISGLDAEGTVDKFVLELSEDPKGLFKLIPETALTLDELKRIPGTVSQASVSRLDLQQTADTMLEIIDQIDPSIRQQFDEFCEQANQTLGFSLKDDLLGGLGDVWSSYISTAEASPGFVPSMVMTISVRDEQKLRKVNDALTAMAKQHLAGMGADAPVILQNFTARGNKGHRLQFNNLPLAISPSWVITKDQLVVGLTPQLVTAHLGSARAQTSLADLPEIQAAFQREPKILSIVYRDPKPELQALYTIINTFSPIALGQLQQLGIDFNFPPLPPLSDIEPHLAPSIQTVVQTKQGWRTEGHRTVPSFSTNIAVSAIGVALILPAVQQGREAARRTMARNTLKQIALAMFNYESEHSKFPDRVILDKNDNPGLSWRVQILPYLDQQELYEQFHLDEPWDSEHNRSLIEKMPAIYASPNDPELTAEGKTRYVVLVGEGTLFEDEEGPRIADITDGTSNTIMAVEAHPDAAVVWTAPDDFEIDEDNLLEGLAGSRTGGFQALMADGAVRFISENLSLDSLRALMTSAGGENTPNF